MDKKYRVNQSNSIEDLIRSRSAQPRTRRLVGDFNDIRPLRSAQSESAGSDKQQHRESRSNFNGDTSTSHADNNWQEQKYSTDKKQVSEQEVIDNTRSEIDESKIGKESRWSKHKAKKEAKKIKRSTRPAYIRFGRKFFKYSFIILALFGIYTAAVSFNAINSIIDRGGEGAVALQDNVQPSALKGEGDGRINIMLLGIGGENHTAGNLADSIIVASIDPFANELAMLSVPRDMYVEIPGYYSTRINAAHSIGEDDPEYPNGGIGLTKDTLESVLGIDIHYYARLDFQGFVEAVNTVGGVTVNLDEAIFDPNFDWEFGSNSLNLPAGENHLDGQTALLLARSRNASGLGFGTGTDFDRGDNQRKILLALKDKILRAGTYSNPLRLTELIRTAGNHARTDIQISEMIALNEIIARIPADNIVSFGLNNSPDNYLVSANIGGAAVLQPRDGTFDEIKIFVRQLFTDGFIKQESPVLDIYNGSTVPGLASETATELETYGYQVGIVQNAPTQDYQQTVVYDLTNSQKEFTKQLLSKRFGVTVKSGNQLPAELATTQSDFVIILGANIGTEAETNL